MWRVLRTCWVPWTEPCSWELPLLCWSCPLYCIRQGSDPQGKPRGRSPGSHSHNSCADSLPLPEMWSRALKLQTQVQSQLLSGHWLSTSAFRDSVKSHKDELRHQLRDSAVGRLRDLRKPLTWTNPKQQPLAIFHPEKDTWRSSVPLPYMVW